MKRITLPANLWFWCLIVAICAGNGFLVIITVANPKYLPLIGSVGASLIALIGTGITAYVAYRLLKFHHESQENPLNLELYKNQIAVIRRGYRLASKAYHLVSIYRMFHKLGSDKYASEYSSYARKFTAHVVDLALLAPEHLLQDANNLKLAFNLVPVDAGVELDAYYKAYVQSCRDAIYADRLSSKTYSFIYQRETPAPAPDLYKQLS